MSQALNKIESDDENVEVPLLTSWQSMPLSLIAIAWNNNEFRKEFIKDPNVFLREIISDCPHNVSFCVLENTDTERHLILPHRDIRTFGWTEQKIKQQLLDEIGYDLNNLDYGLPNELIVRCFLDLDFKKELLISPFEVLKRESYHPDPTYTYYIHENTPFTSHILLPFNKWSGKQMTTEQLELQVTEELKAPALH